ncbi:MAG: Smr/MutS family protein [Alphaproteobacteria bacterium]|nr:Smr/MutS family protein [Alphaproteobacteria bacterium]
MTKMKRRLAAPDIRKLRADKTIDLHGKTSMDAFNTVIALIKSSSSDGCGAIKFITGVGDPKRGTGVIRREFPLWLEHPSIAHLIKSFTYSSGVYLLKIRK